MSGMCRILTLPQQIGPYPMSNIKPAEHAWVECTANSFYVIGAVGKGRVTLLAEEFQRLCAALSDIAREMVVVTLRVGECSSSANYGAAILRFRDGANAQVEAAGRGAITLETAELRLLLAGLSTDNEIP